MYVPITSVQLTLDRVVGGNPQESLNGYMVAPREDAGDQLGPDVVYVGNWEMGTDMKLICDGVSAFMLLLFPTFRVRCFCMCEN